MAFSNDKPAHFSEEQFLSLIQYISEIVALIDADGRIQFVSPQVERVLGFRPDEVAGRSIFDFVHPDDAPRAALEYSETLQKHGEGVPSVLRLRDATGAWIPFEIIANNKLDDPDIGCVIFVARDIRYREEVEEALS